MCWGVLTYKETGAEPERFSQRMRLLKSSKADSVEFLHILLFKAVMICGVNIILTSEGALILQAGILIRNETSN